MVLAGGIARRPKLSALKPTLALLRILPRVLAGAVLVSAEEAACVDILSGSALGSVEAAFVGPALGSCAADGGAATGGVAPDGAVTLCCRDALVAPG